MTSREKTAASPPAFGAGEVTLRDYFAAAALAGVLAADGDHTTDSYAAARSAYYLADRMLAERENDFDPAAASDDD